MSDEIKTFYVVSNKEGYCFSHVVWAGHSNPRIVNAVFTHTENAVLFEDESDAADTAEILVDELDMDLFIAERKVSQSYLDDDFCNLRIQHAMA